VLNFYTKEYSFWSKWQRIILALPRATYLTFPALPQITQFVVPDDMVAAAANALFKFRWLMHLTTLSFRYTTSQNALTSQGINETKQLFARQARVHSNLVKMLISIHILTAGSSLSASRLRSGGCQS
jgi:hypothetical protein